MASTLSIAVEILKVLPGILLFPFSIYLAWKKTGQSVGVSFSVGVGGFSATRITSIVFTNKKDKPLPIFSVFLLINKDIVVPVEKFDPPLVLKGLEVMQVETRPFSTYYIGSEQFKLSFDVIRDAEFFIVTSSGILRCKILSTYSDVSYAYKNDLNVVSKSTSTFNGLVYNEHALFAISYLINGQQKTGLVDRSGFIGGDWDFHYNTVPLELLTKEGIWEFIKRCGYDKLFQGVGIDELQPGRAQ